MSGVNQAGAGRRVVQKEAKACANVLRQEGEGPFCSKEESSAWLAGREQGGQWREMKGEVIKGHQTLFSFQNHELIVNPVSSPHCDQSH